MDNKEENKKPSPNFNKLIQELSKAKEVPYYKGLNNLYTTKYSGSGYDFKDISKAIKDMDVELMRRCSKYFYETSTSYRRMIDHFAGMFLYYYYFNLDNIDGVSKQEVLKKYQRALKILDSICANDTLRDIVTEVMITGSYYGYVNIFKDGNYTLTKLNPRYCRTRFKSPYGNNLVEFNVQYFSTLSDDNERAFVLERMPHFVSEFYTNWRDGKEELPWVNFPAESACCFFMDEPDGAHCPPIFDTIIDIISFDEEKDIEKEKDAQQLEKILVQRFKLDEDGDLELFLEELAEIQKAVAEMFSENKYIDVLTTIAEQVELLDSKSGANTSTATNNNIVKMMIPKYENAGLSSEIFYATTATAANLSIINSTSFISKLNGKLSNWLEVFLLGNIPFGKMRPNVEILPITWYNKEKMVASYLSAAQSGFQKILPYISNGGKQSNLISSLVLENDILGLNDKLIPLSTSYTQSAQEKMPQEDKTEETVRTSDGRTEDRSETNTN